MKKIIIPIIILSSFVFSLCACERAENMLSEISKDIQSSPLSQILPSESSLFYEESEISNIEPSLISGITSSSTENTNFSLSDFRTAYSEKNFEISDTLYNDGQEAIFVKKTDGGDTTSYKIVIFKNEEEAAKALKNETDKGNGAETKGNALIIYEKGYKNHDEYILPFNNVVNK